MWAARAEAIVNAGVLPALNRQADVFKAAQPTATHDAGAWRLPQGEAYYDFGLRYFTTTNMTGDEVHEMGLALKDSPPGFIPTSIESYDEGYETDAYQGTGEFADRKSVV